MLSRPSNYWLVCLAGFSQQAGAIVGSAIKAINKDKYKINSISMSPDLNQGGCYTSSYVSKLIKTAYEMAFGRPDENEKTEWISPSKFCDHIDRPCYLTNPGKQDCKKQKNEACGRRKPKFILVLYADGNGTPALLEKFSRFAFSRGIIRRELLSPISDVPIKIRLLFDALEKRYAYLKDQIDKPPTIVETPFILPVRNFVGKYITMPELLRSARDMAEDARVARDRAHGRWRIPDGSHGYRDRRDLDFEPAQTAQHGKASIPDDRIADYVYALSKYYRLGIPYSERLHFDVSRRNDPINLQFECSRLDRWTEKVTSKHINIYPNDAIGFAS